MSRRVQAESSRAESGGQRDREKQARRGQKLSKLVQINIGDQQTTQNMLKLNVYTNDRQKTMGQGDEFVTRSQNFGSIYLQPSLI